MEIFPAIDLYDKKAVRLLKGDYNKMTVYSDNPSDIAKDFENCGAKFVHIVDLQGAKDGNTPNLDVVLKIKNSTKLSCEIGGGIRNMETVSKYLDAGIDRVILGTAAVENREFLVEAIRKYKNRIVVGVDVKDGFVAVKGWLEKSKYTLFDFCKQMQELGVDTIICTDISKDGAMQGTNVDMYKKLKDEYSMKIIASGGVSSIEDVLKLKNLGIYGAIIGKAYYTKAIDLAKAIEVAK